MDVKKNDVIWAYLARGFSLGVNIILLPLIMCYLSDVELGLWYVFASISQVVNLFDFGFNATLSRHMTYAWSGAKTLEKTSVGEFSSEEHNEQLMSAVIATCRIVYFVISFVALVTMLTVGSVYIDAVLKHQFLLKYKNAWFIYTAAVFMNLFYGYWSSLLQGIGAVADRNKMNVYAKIIQLLLAFILLLQGFGLLGFVISYAVSGMALRFIGKAYFLRRTKAISLERRVGREEKKNCFQAVWVTAWKDGFVMLAQYLSTQANTLICAYYIDLSATSSYGVITQIASVIASVAGAYFSAFQPQYSSKCLKRDIKGQQNITSVCTLLYKLIFGLGVAGFIVVGVPLLKVIRPEMQFNFVMILAVCMFYYLYNQHALFASMIASSNEIPYYKSFVLTALCSVSLSVILTKYTSAGLWGLVAAQIFVNLLYNNWKWPLYVMNRLNLKYQDIYRIGYRQLKEYIKGNE